MTWPQPILSQKSSRCTLTTSIICEGTCGGGVAEAAFTFFQLKFVLIFSIFDMCIILVEILLSSIRLVYSAPKAICVLFWYSTSTLMSLELIFSCIRRFFNRVESRCVRYSTYVFASRKNVKYNIWTKHEAFHFTKKRRRTYSLHNEQSKESFL